MKDAAEFVGDIALRPPTREVRVKATYHDACHLAHGQGVREQPRALLRAIPGLKLTNLPESDWCCGSAGTYNLTQPEMAARLLERKSRQSSGNPSRRGRDRQPWLLNADTGRITAERAADESRAYYGPAGPGL